MVLFLFFQIMLATNSWKGFQQVSSVNVYEALDVMFKSGANSSIKAYVRVIRKLLDWSKSRHFNMQLPFSLSVISLYLFKVQQSGASSSSVNFSPCCPLVVLQLRYPIVRTWFQKDFLKYMVGGNLILPRICMLKRALRTGFM